ncbi:MAG: hypothetical protein ACPL7D_10435 [Candidatus Sumerlaeaceae bacterium]|jgi:hypothetical protein
MSAPPGAFCGSVITEQARQGNAKKSEKAREKNGSERRNQEHTSNSQGSVLPGKQRGSAEIQGLRISATVTEPVSWFAFENGNLALREPNPDERFAVRVELSDLLTGSSFPGAEVKCCIKEAKSSEVLATTRTLVRVWDPKATFHVENFALPQNDYSPPQITLHLEIAPDQRFARYVAAPTAVIPSPFAVELGPYPIPEKRPRHETTSTLRRSLLRPYLEGRHPPVEPTPYPGAKTRN